MLRHQSGQHYIPGICNIGPIERRRRRMGGYAGTLVALLMLAGLLYYNVPYLWRLLLIVPATGAAIGFLQDALHFCAGFGMKGIYNVINSVGVVNDVDLEEFRLKDKRKALQIALWSLAIGLVFTSLSLLIP